MLLPKRKPLRLKGYDYSRNGAYFITICTKDRRGMLSDITVGDAAHGVPNIRLTQIGEIVNGYILNINNVYENVYVDKYVIMPNHLHLIIVIEPGRDAVGGVPYGISVPKIINSLKTLTSKEFGETLWQRSYYDHIIRDEKDYLGIWQCIDENSQQWQEDCYYNEMSGGNNMEVVFEKPKSMADVTMHYCPGCTHGIIHRLVAEAIDELDIEGKTVGVAPVGCSVMAYNYFNCDMAQAAHGRAPAVATGLKRANPDNIVFTYQGDGDLAAIGTAETVHAAARGENITIIFVNNAIYGMTGGQMAPTTLPGQVTQTTPYGRDVATAGLPIRVCEMLATVDGSAYIERVSVDSVKNIKAAKKAITKAFKNQVEGKGFSLVEVVSTCPTNWGLDPVAAMDWLRENMLPYYPLGVFKDKTKEGADQ